MAVDKSLHLQMAAEFRRQRVELESRIQDLLGAERLHLELAGEDLAETSVVQPAATSTKPVVPKVVARKVPAPRKPSPEVAALTWPEVVTRILESESPLRAAEIARRARKLGRGGDLTNAVLFGTIQNALIRHDTRFTRDEQKQWSLIK